MVIEVAAEGIVVIVGITEVLVVEVASSSTAAVKVVDIKE